MNSKRIRKRYNKNSKILIIMVLTIGVIGLSIGFAAFSKNLNINSTASVTPDPSDFKVLFSSSETAVATDPIRPVYGLGTSATIDNNDSLHPKITGIKATFTNPPSGTGYDFYVRNEGKYTAYLKKVEFGTKTCTAKDGTSQELVDKACEGIHMYIRFNNAKVFSTSDMTVSNYPLEKGASQEIRVWMSYSDDASLADGDFDVEFGDLTLTYSTTDS